LEGGLQLCSSLCHKSNAFTETGVQVACKQSQCCNSSTAAFTDLDVRHNNGDSINNEENDRVDILGQGPVNINEEVLSINDEFCSLGYRQINDVSRVNESMSRQDRQMCDVDEVMNTSKVRDSQFQVNHIQSLDSKRPDPRSISVAEISTLVYNNEYLDGGQKENLTALLRKYAPFFTSKPGKCLVFEDEFRLYSESSTNSATRPVPYNLRPVTREQIKQLIEDDALEIANSPFISLLTIVHRDGKAPKICVDARKINRITVPVPPLNELLQRFNGVRYMTSIDLSFAFLQIPLKEQSRQFSAFLFDSTVYQYKRVPYGF
jgi:hypothetical protein